MCIFNASTEHYVRSSKQYHQARKQYFNFCSQKDIVKKKIRQATDQQQMFAQHTSNRELISNIYKELLEPNNKNTTQPKQAKGLKRAISPEKNQNWEISI